MGIKMFRHKILITASYLYLLLPLLLFVAAWVALLIAIPLILMIFYSFYALIKNSPLEDLNYRIKRKKVLIIVGVIIAWVVLSGIGGFVWQNRYDHMFRNAIFNDLFFSNWPVVSGKELGPLTLCYYIGYWLPSALVAKIGGNINLGYIFQLIWGVIGVVIAFFLISLWLKTISYKALFVFVFFSGLDILICVWLFPMHHTMSVLSLYSHIELLLLYFNASSNTTLLFWVYNQSIPFWVGFFLLINLKGKESLFITYSLLFLYCPFPAVGLFPCVIYWMFKDFKIDLSNLKKTFCNLLREYLTIENSTGLIICLILIFFYKSNVAAGQISLLPFSLKMLYLFSLYLVFEYLVYIIFIYKRIARDKTFFILFFTMMICSFITLGEGSDFGWRTCIPFSSYLMVLVMREMVVFYDKGEIKHKLLIIVLAIGAVTPLLEINRTISHTIFHKNSPDPFLSDGLDSVFEKMPNGGRYVNFIGNSDSFFFKYIMRKSPYQ